MDIQEYSSQPNTEARWADEVPSGSPGAQPPGTESGQGGGLLGGLLGLLIPKDKTDRLVLAVITVVSAARDRTSTDRRPCRRSPLGASLHVDADVGCAGSQLPDRAGDDGRGPTAN